MTRTVAGIEIPDSAMAREVTELVRDAADDLLFGHSCGRICGACCTAATAAWHRTKCSMPQRCSTIWV